MASAEHTPSSLPPQPASRRRLELTMFLFLAVVFWPLVAVAIVSGYGFAVWIGDLLFGPPRLI